MITFKDKTFCASICCDNKCGRKKTDEEKQQLKDMSTRINEAVSWSYFCSDYDFGKDKENE